LPLPRVAQVLLQLLLHGGEERGVHQRRHGDGDPLLRRDVGRRDRAAWLQAPPALGAQARGERAGVRLPECGRALVGGILEHPPHGGPVPDGLSRPGLLAGPGQPPADLADRRAFLPDPGEDLAHHARLLQHDLVARLPAALGLPYISIPIWCGRQHADGTGVGGMAFAATTTLEDLGPLILRDHALHLEEERILGGLARCPVEEDDRDAGALEFLQQQHLVGIPARQAVGRMDIEAIQAARRGQIAQLLEPGPHQRRPAVALIHEVQLRREGQAVGGDPRLQGSDLARDGLGRRLLLGRDAGVDRGLEGVHAVFPSRGGATLVAGCPGGRRRRRVVRRGVGTSRS
jgi:hypothetical protein